MPFKERGHVREGMLNHHFCTGKEALRFVLCKRWRKQVLTTDTVCESGSFPVVMSFKKTQEL